MREAFERHPDDAGLRFCQSRLLQRQQRPEEALVAARRAIALDPQKPYRHEHLVKLLMEAGEDDEAEAALREALERHPDDAGLRFRQSRLLQRRQRPKEALRPPGARSRSIRRSPTGMSISLSC